MQQLDIQNNENTFHNRNTLTTAKETTSERDDIKYKEMQEQIKILTSEVTKLKHTDSNKEQQGPSKNYQETEPEAIRSPPPTSSPRKYRILPRNDTIFYSQNSKNLQGASAENRGVTKSEIKRSNTSNSKYNANVNRIRKTLQRTIRYHLDPLNNVINLSTKSFTFYEFKLLNKNLNFCPTPNRYNKKQFKNDIETFIRKVKLKAHFKKKEQGIENEEFRISRNKTWTPKENHHTVETFAQAFQNDLLKEEENIKQIPHKNLSKKEEDALQNLSKR